MFVLESIDEKIQAKTFPLTEGLFHEALKENPASHDRFHVKNDWGADFDIVYLDNDKDIEPYDAYPAYVKPPYIPEYRLYDENDRDTLYLDFFAGKKRMVCEEANEYTVALTRVALNFTDMEVYCMDERILWFVPENPRLILTEKLPEADSEGTFYIQKAFRTGLENGNFDTLSATYAMHNVFMEQWLLGGRSRSDTKFLKIDSMGESGGIGSVLAFYRRYSTAAESLGLKLISGDRERFGKYRIGMLEKYFNVSLFDDEADENNTVSIPFMLGFIKTKLVYSIKQPIDKGIISESFKRNMDEYFDTVFENQKVLGVLIRGSDYITSGLSGERLMARPDQMIPTIREWMSEYGYERVFLATEDRDILKTMREEFGKQIVAVAQERIGVSDLKEGQIISEYEKEKSSGEEYESSLEDATVNYFYALYLLSRCDAFICSGQCNGYDVVMSFNDGAFEREYKFAVGVKES